MGWYKIDPDTGKAADKHSALSSPETKLLNAVPGVDDEDAACYLGDAPWDTASTVPKEFNAVTGPSHALSAQELRDLFLRRIVPPCIVNSSPEMAAKLLKIVDAFWADIDGCYEDDWERPARTEEKRWVCEYIVKAFNR